MRSAVAEMSEIIYIFSERKDGSVSILVVGSVALDTVETPFARIEETLGGAASYFTTAASLYNQVNLVAIVGSDFPREHGADALAHCGLGGSALPALEAVPDRLRDLSFLDGVHPA